MVETVRVAERLALAAPDGSSVVVHDVKVRIEREGERFVDVWLDVALRAATWASVDKNAWFHLTQDVRGPVFGGALDPLADVRIEARLAPDLLTALAVVVADKEALLAELLAAKLLRALHLTESWYGLYVTQGDQRLRTGFRTRHADAAW